MYCTVIPQSNFLRYSSGVCKLKCLQWTMEPKSQVRKIQTGRDCIAHVPPKGNALPPLWRMVAMEEHALHTAGQEKPKTNILRENSWQLTWKNFIHNADETSHISGLKLAQITSTQCFFFGKKKINFYKPTPGKYFPSSGDVGDGSSRALVPGLVSTLHERKLMALGF